MTTRYSIAQRTPWLNSLFAGLACVATLTLTAGPALAAPGELGRVEVKGRVVEAPVRYDVSTACAGLERQLQDALQTTWLRERQSGMVQVQFLMQGNEIENVRARGITMSVEQSVRKAVQKLDCSAQNTADARIYRFNVVFIDPYAPGYANAVARSEMAAGQPAVRVALAQD